MSGFAPDHANAEVMASPNFGLRRDGCLPDMVILHYTGMASGAEAQVWLCNCESEVSSHYIVHEDGRVVQMVREADRAWHAGRSSWHGVSDINSCSIGIEIVNPGHPQAGQGEVLGAGSADYPDFTDLQIAAVMELCAGIIDRYNMTAERILAHSDVAPGRKIDPGERFPWARLAAAGIGHFVAPAAIVEGPVLAEGDEGPEVERMQAALCAYGYGIGVSGRFDPPTKAVVVAFQRHFRPARVDGVADRSTLATLDRLLAALPEAAGV